MKSKQSPIIVAMPNIAREKWEAIVALAKSNQALAEAITSVTVDVNISNCVVKASDGTGISVQVQ